MNSPHAGKGYFAGHGCAAIAAFLAGVFGLFYLGQWGFMECIRKL
jgi:hypothetical protein